MTTLTASSSARRRVALAFVSIVGLAITDIASTQSASRADDSSTLTVVGTSDVYDSNLVQAVLKPGFEAYEQSLGTPITLNYVSMGTGAAITYAEAGTASALLVHAASLENQFVAAGYSYEQYGRAIFYGDYVLLGPKSDPAGVLTNARHNIVRAYEDVARAGWGGNANFVSRGGTPGTTVQEHAIWALTTGVRTCKVSVKDGGGTSPSKTAGHCPRDPDPIPYPDWYHATGLTQGPNILNGDACNYGSATNDCYVFTDRGTYQYLNSRHEITNLRIVTRDNSPAAIGGNTLLVNSFHAYAVNPAKFSGDPNVSINLTGAEDFLNWVTSPDAQAAVGAYLSRGGDPPFLPDAAPSLTVTKRPAPKVAIGHSFTVNGTLANVAPGTPPLADQTVVLLAKPDSDPDASPVAVSSTSTRANGTFTIRYAPSYNATYTVATGEISQIENATLNPVFGDLLSPSSASVRDVRVLSSIAINHASARTGKVTLTGAVTPKSTAGAQLSLFGKHAGSSGPLHLLRAKRIKAGTHHYSTSFHVTRGFTWKLRLRYANPGVIDRSSSRVVEVTVN